MDQQAVLEVASAAIGDAAPAPDTPQISVAVGIVVALAASWLSSLGERVEYAGELHKLNIALQDSRYSARAICRMSGSQCRLERETSNDRQSRCEHAA
jgi:hypothetical protein